jgi:hypothetical protein
MCVDFYNAARSRPCPCTIGKSHFVVRPRLCHALFIRSTTNSFFIICFLQCARQKTHIKLVVCHVFYYDARQTQRFEEGQVLIFAFCRAKKHTTKRCIPCIFSLASGNFFPYILLWSPKSNCLSKQIFITLKFFLIRTYNM